MRIFLSIASITIILGGQDALARDKQCITENNTEICQHYFTGDKVPLPAEIIVPTNCDKLKSELTQVSTRLSMPLGEGIVSDNCTLADEYYFPNIEREILVRNEISYMTSEKTWNMLHTSDLIKIYPKTLMEPLKKWATQNTLVVKDRHGELEAFLDKFEIEYSSRLLSSANQTTKPVIMVTNYEKDIQEDAYWASKNANIIFFYKNIQNLPKITRLTKNSHTHIHVEMKLLDELYERPLAQKALIEIFSLSQKTNH